MDKKNRTAYFGMFIALALIVSYVEAQIPFYFGVPGIKIGLANIVILLALYIMGARSAWILSVTRILLAGFLFGNLYSIIYSLAGGVLSLAVMMLCRRLGCFSLKGISVAGGVFHNIGQIILAACIVETWSIAFYLPLLLAAGVAAGLLTGFAAEELLKRLPDYHNRRN